MRKTRHVFLAPTDCGPLLGLASRLPLRNALAVGLGVGVDAERLEAAVGEAGDAVEVGQVDCGAAPRNVVARVGAVRVPQPRLVQTLHHLVWGGGRGSER